MLTAIPPGGKQLRHHSSFVRFRCPINFVRRLKRFRITLGETIACRFRVRNVGSVWLWAPGNGSVARVFWQNSGPPCRSNTPIGLRLNTPIELPCMYTVHCLFCLGTEEEKRNHRLGDSIDVHSALS